MLYGIDISKDTLDVAVSDGGSYKLSKYANTPSGIMEFLRRLTTEDHCVMESTGPYWYRLATQLLEASYKVSVVNPLQIKRFAQMQLRRTKTDTVDACIICAYGTMVIPAPMQPFPAFILQLKQLRSVARQLTKTHTDFSNQLHALAQMPATESTARTACKTMLLTIEKQLAHIEQQMEDIVTEHCAKTFHQLQSIPAIGKKTAMELIITTNNFTTITAAKSYSSYIGTCPRVTQSGTSVLSKGNICKVGSSYTRKLLYICSWSAVRCNHTCRQLYHRLLAAGKPKMVALIAVANKLIKQIFAIVLNGTMYDENFSSNVCF